MKNLLSEMSQLRQDEKNRLKITGHYLISTGLTEKIRGSRGYYIIDCTHLFACTEISGLSLQRGEGGRFKHAGKHGFCSVFNSETRG